MKTLQKLLFLFIVICSAHVWANNDLKEYMQISGMNEQIGGFNETFNAGLLAGTSQGQVQQSYIDQIIRISNNIFMREAMLNELYIELDKKLSADMLKQQLKWYRSELGLKISRLEIESSKPEALQKIAIEGAEILEKSNRAEKYVLFDGLAMGSENAINMTIDMQLAMFSSFGRPQSEIDELKAKIDEQMPLLKKNMLDYLLTYYAYTYQSLTDKEFDQYIAFLSQQTSKQVTNIGVEAIDTVLNSRMKKFGTELGVYFKSLQSQNNGMGPGAAAGPRPPG